MCRIAGNWWDSLRSAGYRYRVAPRLSWIRIARCPIRHWGTLHRGASVRIWIDRLRLRSYRLVVRVAVKRCGRYRRSPARKCRSASVRHASSILMGSGCVSEASSTALASVTLGEVTYGFAWNVRGDAAQESFVVEAEHLLGAPLPLEPNIGVRLAGKVLLWLGPRSWLFAGGTALPDHDFDTTRIALNAAGGALVD